MRRNSLGEGLVVFTKELEKELWVRLYVEFHLPFFCDLKPPQTVSSISLSHVKFTAI